MSKRSVRFALFIVIFLAGMASTATAAPLIALEAQSVSDRQVAVDIRIYNATDLNALDLSLVYDKNIFDLSSITKGSLMPADSWQLDIDEDADGCISPISAKLTSGQTVSGSGIFARLILTAKTPAASVLQFSQVNMRSETGNITVISQDTELIIDPQSFYRTELKKTHAADSSGAIIADDLPVNTVAARNEVIEEGVKADFEVKRRDSDIEMSIAVINELDRPALVEFSSSQRYDFKINRQGDLLWCWSADKLFLMNLETESYAPGVTNYVTHWMIPEAVDSGTVQIELSLAATKPISVNLEMHL